MATVSFTAIDVMRFSLRRNLKNTIKIIGLACLVFMAACSKDGGEDSVEVSVTTPELLTPADDANDVLTMPAFTWEGEGETFSLYISSDNGATWTTLADNLTETSYTPTQEQALLLNTLYLWQVSASESGVTKNSAIYSFRTVASEPPAPVKLTYPADNARYVPVAPTFRWEGEGETFSLYISSDNGATWTALADDLTETSYTPTNEQALLMNTLYLWQVSASGEEGNQNSAVYSFRTVALPSPVTLSSPADGAVVGDVPVLTWESEGTASYSVRVRHVGTGTWTTIAQGLTEPEYTFAGAEMSTAYEWQVLAADPANASLWNQSPVRKFTYMQTRADGEYYLYKDFDGTKVPGGGTPYIIVVTGDGFINTDYDKAGGFFDEKVDFALDRMFNVEPFRSYKDYFRVYKLTAISNMSGISKAGGRISDTKFNLQMPASGNVIGVSEGGNIKASLDFTYENIPEVNPSNIKDVMVMVLANSTEHGGVNWFWDNGEAVVITSMGVSYDRTFVHESGHRIGYLADEYYTAGRTMSEEERQDNIAKQQANLWEVYPNVDFTGDRSKALWSKYYGMEGYDIDYVEGGEYCEFGVWRSTEGSLMSGVTSPFWFNVVSREAIVRHIMKLAGQEFVWEDFLAKDDDTKYVP